MKRCEPSALRSYSPYVLLQDSAAGNSPSAALILRPVFPCPFRVERVARFGRSETVKSDSVHDMIEKLAKPVDRHDWKDTPEGGMQ